jgi:hypothetical protein
MFAITMFSNWLPSKPMFEEVKSRVHGLKCWLNFEKLNICTLDWLFHGSIYCWNPSSNPSLSETRGDHRPDLPLTKGFKLFILNQPINRHLEEFKSTIRIDLACSGAKINGFLNITNFSLVLEQKNCCSIEIGLRSQLNLQCRWSSPLFVTVNRFLEPLKGSSTSLFMQLCLSCLNGICSHAWSDWL